MSLLDNQELKISNWVNLKNKTNEVAIVGIANGEYQGVNVKGESFNFIRSDVHSFSRHPLFYFMDTIIIEEFGSYKYLIYNHYDGWSFFSLADYNGTRNRLNFYKTKENARKAALVHLGKVAEASQKKRVADRAINLEKFARFSFVVGDEISGLLGKDWKIYDKGSFSHGDMTFFIIDSEDNKTSATGSQLLKLGLKDPQMEMLRQAYINFSVEAEENVAQSKILHLKAKFIRSFRQAFNEKNI